MPDSCIAEAIAAAQARRARIQWAEGCNDGERMAVAAGGGYTVPIRATFTSK
jgi:hypothetical protein